jgi:hypothetical protein
MPLKFWIGVALCVGGIVLMSLPEKPCEDCEDDVITTVTETIDEVTE